MTVVIAFAAAFSLAVGGELSGAPVKVNDADGDAKVTGEQPPRRDGARTNNLE